MPESGARLHGQAAAEQGGGQGQGPRGDQDLPQVGTLAKGDISREIPSATMLPKVSEFRIKSKFGPMHETVLIWYY